MSLSVLKLSQASLNAARQQVKPFAAAGSQLQRHIEWQSTRSMTVLSKQSAEEYKKMNYTDRMKKTGRPVSPHVTIYTFPIAAITSILNRVTGVTLSFGCAGLGALELLGGPGSALHLMETVGSSSVLLAGPAKFAVAFPLVYHYGGGLRHAVWDKSPDKLTTDQVEQASYALLGGSVVISLGLMFV